MEYIDNIEQGSLRVWWMPQVPMESFKVEVNSVEEGVKVMDILAQYDMFEYNNNVKGDYSNAGGLSKFDGDDWEDWDIETEDGRYYDDPHEYVKDMKNEKD